MSATVYNDTENTMSFTKVIKGKTITFEMNEDTFTRWGKVCERVEFKAIDSDGNEIGFAWAEQTTFGDYGAFRWSDMVGQVGLPHTGNGSDLRTKSGAMRVAREHAWKVLKELTR